MQQVQKLDLNQVGLSVNYEDLPDDTNVTLPDGEYMVLIEEAYVQENNNKDGHFIFVKFKVTQGQYRGVNVVNRYNIANPNEQAVNIGKAQLKSLMAAINLENQVLDTCQKLMNKPLKISVTSKKSQYNGKEYINNEVKSYNKIDVAAASVNAQQLESGTQTAAGGVSNSAPAASLNTGEGW